MHTLVHDKLDCSRQYSHPLSDHAGPLRARFLPGGSFSFPRILHQMNVSAFGVVSVGSFPLDDQKITAWRCSACRSRAFSEAFSDVRSTYTHSVHTTTHQALFFPRHRPVRCAVRLRRPHVIWKLQNQVDGSYFKIQTMPTRRSLTCSRVCYRSIVS